MSGTVIDGKLSGEFDFASQLQEMGRGQEELAGSLVTDSEKDQNPAQQVEAASKAFEQEFERFVPLPAMQTVSPD
jgi:hypothetical protein